MKKGSLWEADHFRPYDLLRSPGIPEFLAMYCYRSSPGDLHKRGLDCLCKGRFL